MDISDLASIKKCGGFMRYAKYIILIVFMLFSYFVGYQTGKTQVKQEKIYPISTTYLPQKGNIDALLNDFRSLAH
jgi:hypothetical protein